VTIVLTAQKKKEMKEDFWNSVVESCTISVSSALAAWYLSVQLWLQKLVARCPVGATNFDIKGD